MHTNDWTLNGFVKEISQLDLAVMDFPHNIFSLFGQSRPDLAFIKMERAVLVPKLQLQ